MEAITRRFVVPPRPVAPKIDSIYPWEQTELMVICQRLYRLAMKTGYVGTFNEFKANFGSFLRNNNIITTDDFEFYYGQYNVTPMPLISQILNTKDKILINDVVVTPIPYAITTNVAGGYTAIIG